MNSSMNEISAVMVQSPLRIVPLAMGQAFDTGALGAIGSSSYNVEGNNEESLALIKKGNHTEAQEMTR